jgi:hypothetical protein
MRRTLLQHPPKDEQVSPIAKVDRYYEAAAVAGYMMSGGAEQERRPQATRSCGVRPCGGYMIGSGMFGSGN